jgi:hypothetical protein
MHDLMADKKNVQREGQATCEHSQIMFARRFHRLKGKEGFGRERDND